MSLTYINQRWTSFNNLNLNKKYEITFYFASFHCFIRQSNFICHGCKVEAITSTLREKKKVGGEYSQRQSAGHKHVVVCATSLKAENIMDFLIEFYAHPKLEDHIVVLLSSEERDTSLQMLLKDPKWAHRVIYMRGSALKDIDLYRCRLIKQNYFCKDYRVHFKNSDFGINVPALII